MIYLMAALGFCLLLEAFLPFVSPKLWRQSMARLLILPDKTLRIGAGCLMVLAAVLVHFSVLA
jgi:uncharacterized protein YjeT (DUF2065 family)